MALSYAFDPSKGETPETIARRRQTADLIASRIFGKAPANVGEGLNAIGQALIARQMQSEATDAQAAGMASVPALFGGTGANPAAGIAASIAGQPITPSAAVASSPMGDIPPPAAPTTGKIYSNDEPSPLDPPSGQDRQAMIATILGEAGNQGPAGMNAVGSVIRNRAVSGSFGGDTPAGVVTAKNQFEPWNTAEGRARMARAAADPQQAAAADAAISAAYGEGGQAPNDPTNGATMFFDPKLQASLGRQVPPWAQGPGQDIGDHRFFGGAPMQPTQVADAGNAIPSLMSGGMIGNAPPADRQAMAFAGPTAPQPLASPAGTPPTAPASDGEDALPANAAPAQGALPTTQAVQAATPGAGGPFPNVSTEDLTKYAMNQFVPAANRQVIAAEITRRATAAQQASDPAHQLDIQAKQLAIKKAQQDLDKPSDKMQVVKIGQDSLGREQYGIFNKSDGSIKPYTPPNGGTPDPLGNTDLSGKEYLATLPKEQANTVQLMVEGKIPPPTSFAMSKPYWQNMISAAKNYDPTFDATAWSGRVAGTRDFSAGKSAEMVRSANQTLHHVGSLLDSMDKLNNGTYPMINSIGNTIAEARGSGAQGAFRTNAHAVAEELSKVFKGNNLSDAEIRSWEQNLHENMSPEQQRTQVAKLNELLQGSLHALDEKRTASIGPIAAEKAGPIIKDEGRRVIERINNWVQNGSDAKAQKTPAAPQGKTSSGISWSIQ